MSVFDIIVTVFLAVAVLAVAAKLIYDRVKGKGGECDGCEGCPSCSSCPSCRGCHAGRDCPSRGKPDRKK